jgi:hypothetical protein
LGSDPFGHHLFSCACGDRIRLHDAGIHAWRRILSDARCLSVRTEVLLSELDTGTELSRDDSKLRMDVVARLHSAIPLPRVSGEFDFLWCDFTLVDPCCDSYLSSSSRMDGSTVRDAEKKKIAKYGALIDDVDNSRIFIPLGIECYGSLGRHAIDLLHALAQVVSIDNERDESLARGRLVDRWLSIIASMVQKGVAYFMLNRIASINGRSMPLRVSIHELLHARRATVLGS